MDILRGNAAEDGSERGGWFVGHFMPSDRPLISREDAEVKWYRHPAGDRNPGGWTANRTATTLSLLVEGEFVLRFRTSDGEREERLSRPGDYCLWAPGVEHDWEAETDAVMLTVRFPSVARDQGAAGPEEAANALATPAASG